MKGAITCTGVHNALPDLLEGCQPLHTALQDIDIVPEPVLSTLLLA